MGLELQWPISVRGGEKVGPFEDFGKAELVQGNNDGADRLLRADHKNFDRFPIRLGVAVELEGEFEVDWSLAGGGLVGGREEGLCLHDNYVNH